MNEGVYNSCRVKTYYVINVSYERNGSIATRTMKCERTPLSLFDLYRRMGNVLSDERVADKDIIRYDVFTKEVVGYDNAYEKSISI